MNLGKPFTRLLLLLILGGVGLAGIYSLVVQRVSGAPSLYLAARPDDAEEARFAPADNLEDYDLSLLDSAKSRVDVAMYAFTDEKLADELLKLANRGVEIRLYRDGLQLSDETARAEKRSGIAATLRLSNNPRIHIRVKASSASMHLKAYCIDGSVLRTGSANWSQSGERSQDNDVYVLRDSKVVQKFETDFEELWDRSNNRIE